jgi:hypothetical protein
MPKPVRTTIFKCLPHYYSALDGGLLFQMHSFQKLAKNMRKIMIVKANGFKVDMCLIVKTLMSF